METFVLTLGSIASAVIAALLLKHLFYMAHHSFVMFIIERNVRKNNENFIKKTFL